MSDGDRQQANSHTNLAKLRMQNRIASMMQPRSKISSWSATTKIVAQIASVFVLDHYRRIALFYLPSHCRYCRHKHCAFSDLRHYYCRVFMNERKQNVTVMAASSSSQSASAVLPNALPSVLCHGSVEPFGRHHIMIIAASQSWSTDGFSGVVSLYPPSVLSGKLWYVFCPWYS